MGGEQSGHVIFGDIASTGDGILTSLRLMEAIRAERETLSQLCAPVKLYPQLLTNVRVADKDAAMNDAAVLESVKAAEEFLGDRGRVLLRASGTEPLIRVLAEAPTDELCAEASEFMLKALEPLRAE